MIIDSGALLVVGATLYVFFMLAIIDPSSGRIASGIVSSSAEWISDMLRTQADAREAQQRAYKAVWQARKDRRAHKGVLDIASVRVANIANGTIYNTTLGDATVAESRLADRSAHPAAL